MKRYVSHLAIVAIATAVFFNGCSNTSENPIQLATDNQNDVLLDGSTKSGTPIPNQYIIVLKPESGIQSNISMVTARVNSILSDYAIPQQSLGFIYESAIQGFSVKIDAQKVGMLIKDPRIKYIEQDKVITLDPLEVSNSSSKSEPTVLSQTTPWGISRVGGAGNGVGKTGWIIDTGIDLDNPDLTVNTAKSKAFISGNNPDDGNGHGTHVAGIIAAKDNTSYVVGVAAGATVVAVRVLNSKGSGTTSSVIAGVNYVSNNAAAGDVANMSLGGGVSTSLDDAAISAAAKGIKFAIAAGNDGANANNSSPARVNGANIYTVTAINSSDVMASWSNYGNPPCDFAAPGVSILSLWKNAGTKTISGTSMATPHVAGILLLGAVSTNGYASGDPDGNPDPIAHR